LRGTANAFELKKYSVNRRLFAIQQRLCLACRVRERPSIAVDQHGSVRGDEAGHAQTSTVSIF